MTKECKFYDLNKYNPDYIRPTKGTINEIIDHTVNSIYISSDNNSDAESKETNATIVDEE